MNWRVSCSANGCKAHREGKGKTLGECRDAWKNDGWRLRGDGSTALLCPTCAEKSIVGERLY